MPIYEFKCEDCGEEFEIFLKNKEEINKAQCKKCGGKNLKRLMSIVNTIISEGDSKAERPRITESHSCPTGTCTHMELPGYGD